MYLGIDTCTRWLNLALLGADGSVLAEFRESLPTHTTRLAPEIRNLLTEAGSSPGSLKAVGVVLGPGSFTGLRVGLAAAEGLGQALAIPPFGISSLKALALSCAREGMGVALLDARRSQVYAQRFERGGEEVRAAGGATATSPGDLDTKGLRWAVGDGVPLVSGWPADCALLPEIPNLALQAAREALRNLASGLSPAPLKALYIRPPDVREPGPGPASDPGSDSPRRSAPG